MLSNILFNIHSNEQIYNMTGGVDEGVVHLTGLWGYIRQKRLATIVLEYANCSSEVGGSTYLI